jgi:ribosomal protein L10
MSSYNELNNLISQSKKFFDKKYKNLSAAEQKELSNLSYKIKITREDLLQKAIHKQLAKQKAVEDYENNNLMKQLSRGE